MHDTFTYCTYILYFSLWILSSFSLLDHSVLRTNFIHTGFLFPAWAVLEWGSPAAPPFSTMFFLKFSSFYVLLCLPCLHLFSAASPYFHIPLFVHFLDFLHSFSAYFRLVSFSHFLSGVLGLCMDWEVARFCLSPLCSLYFSLYNSWTLYNKILECLTLTLLTPFSFSLSLLFLLILFFLLGLYTVYSASVSFYSSCTSLLSFSLV